MWAILTILSLAVAGSVNAATTRCLYGQSCFPTPAQLATFNSSIGGRLVAVRPTHVGCFTGPEYNLTSCNLSNKNQANNQWRSDQISAYQQVNFENCGSQNCVPFKTKTCQQGAVPRYGVAATSAEDVVAAVKFATQYNLKTVIKNTGHDYKGRSGAPDSFVIWTHLLNKMTYQGSFVPSGCSAGAPQSALVFGSGVQFVQAITFAHQYKKMLVTGDCGHVGAAGGWLQGGGHGVLTPRYGLGVDQVLQYEVVTADGQLRIANQCQNQDLFWAMRGGGGGTWGVATKAWIKAYDDEELTGVTINAGGINLGQDVTKPILKAFAKIQPALSDIGFGGVLIVEPNIGIIAIGIVPKVNGTQLQNLVAPIAKAFFNVFNSGSILNFGSGGVSYNNYSSYFDFYNATLAHDIEPVGIGARLTSRLIPNELFVGDANLETLSSGILKAASSSGPSKQLPIQILIGNPIRTPDTERSTSVTPAWRNSQWHVIITGAWTESTSVGSTKATADGINAANAVLKSLAPNSGAYQNEANIDEPDHEQTFWGDNIGRLNTIKKSVDPDNFFTVWHGVGWEGVDANEYKCYDKYT